MQKNTRNNRDAVYGVESWGPRNHRWEGAPLPELAVLRAIHGHFQTYGRYVKKGSPYSITECNSITECRVPELIPVLGSQPAGYVSHKPGCHYFRQACSYPRNP